MNTLTVASERQQVIGYLWGRSQTAFTNGAFEEAQNLHRFMVRLENMSDEVYEEIYQGCEDEDL